jgi:hypothetical protein
MSLVVPLGSQAATTANATFGVAVPTGQIWRIVAINVQQPAASDAKVISIAIGTTATAANVKRQYSLAAGVATAQEFPNIVLVAADQVNIIATGTTAQAVVTITVAKDLIA